MGGGVGVIVKCFVENDFGSGGVFKDGFVFKIDEGKVVVFIYRFEEVQGLVLEFEVVGKIVDLVVDDGSYSFGLIQVSQMGINIWKVQFDMY